MIDLWHFSKKRLNIFWQYKNVERDLSTTLNIQRTFTDFARTGQTWHPKLSAASQKSQRSNIWWYFSPPCNVFLCGSGRCSKSDFPSNWVRQRAQRTLHGQFPGPAPAAQRPNLPSPTNNFSVTTCKLSILAFQKWNIDIGIEDKKDLAIGWNVIHTAKLLNKLARLEATFVGNFNWPTQLITDRGKV